MKKQATRPRMLFIVVSLFASSVLFAQPPADTSADSFLDFSQFSMIAPADRLGFLDHLKWAGMRFVNAPAARRVVSLYEYSSDAIANVTCSDDRLRDHHALVVTELVPTNSVIVALESHRSGQSTAGNIEELIRQLPDPEVNPWMTTSGLQDFLQKDPSLPNNVSDPMPVWGELSFSNSCELQQMVEDLDYDAVTWHPVDNPKLRSFIQSEPDQTTSAKIIATGSFFPEHIETAQYFAECLPANERPHVGSSYCDTVR